MQPVEFIDSQNPAYLFVTHISRDPVRVPLEENNSLFLGSGSSCGVQLTGRGVEPIHCMFWMNEEGVVRVQDWNTAIGILINGQNVSAETVVNSGDELVVGNYKIVPVLSADVHHQLGGHMASTEFRPESAVDSDDPPSNVEGVAESVTGESGEEVVEDEFVTNEFVSDETGSNETVENEVVLTETVPEAEGELFVTEPNRDAESESEFEYDVMADLDGLDEDEVFESSFGGDQNGFDDAAEIDQRQNEELELLRMEVEQLRFELAEREAVGEADSDQPGPVGHEEDDSTIQLVNRLEDLLEELRVSDERVRGLEDLLRASDQATQAEREERLQLESWVTEIEERVAERESESTAELSRLKDRLAESTSRHRQTQVQLKKVLKSQTGQPGSDSSEMIAKLNEQIEALQTKLDHAAEENEQLRQNPVPTTGDGSRESMRETEQKLLQLQVETSRERAEMARQKAELEQLRGELGEKLNEAKKSGNGDARLKAMREHLREIHQQEKLEAEEKKRRSLGGRISRLLSKSTQ